MQPSPKSPLHDGCVLLRADLGWHSPAEGLQFQAPREARLAVLQHVVVEVRVAAQAARVATVGHEVLVLAAAFGLLAVAPSGVFTPLLRIRCVQRLLCGFPLRLSGLARVFTPLL